MYVDWEYYKIFYYVARYQNFTKAARVLGSNQPNITHMMNKLEEQLHCVLFIRSNRSVTLMPFKEILVGGPTFVPLAERTLTLRELADYPLIMLDNESMTHTFYRRFFLERSAELKPDIEAATTDQLLTLVRSELGLAFVPEPMAHGNLHRKCIVQLQEAIPPRSICLVYDQHRPLNTAAREFQRQLCNSAKEATQ